MSRLHRNKGFVFIALSVALILSLALSGCGLTAVRNPIIKKLSGERNEAPSAVALIEEEYEESLVEEGFRIAAREVVPEILVEEELHEEEMDVDLSGAFHGEIHRETLPRMTVPAAEPGDDPHEEELNAVVPATVPETLLPGEEPSFDVEEIPLWEELDQEDLGVPAVRARVRVLPEEIVDDFDLEG
jgi:hypothetical protein